MKLHLVLVIAVFYWNIFILQETQAQENFQAKDRQDNETCREKLFSLDDQFSFNHTRAGRRKLRSDEVIDCFGIGGKFASALDWFLKQDSNGTFALKVKFHAISRNKPKRVTLHHGESFSLDDFDFDIKRRTMLIIHGFLSNGNEKWIEDMTNALLKWDDVNVFVVDWSDGSNTWNYYKAAVNTRTVGDQIATFFGQLVDAASESNDVDRETRGPIHFIGHSLGAHICGYAASEMRQRKNKWQVQRITGLDPAQPCFKNSDDKLRLDEGDAPFVDVIHTNGRVLSKLGLGLPNPIGHVDFYPNGGKVQPGCILSESFIWKYLPMPIKKIGQTVCSHGRSHLYFIDSVISAVTNRCTFWAHEWDLTYSNVDTLLRSTCKGRKCIEMGINSEKYSKNGTFFTITGREKPFCYVDKDTKAEVKEIIEKVKKKLSCGKDDVSDDDYTLIRYA